MSFLKAIVLPDIGNLYVHTIKDTIRKYNEDKPKKEKIRLTGNKQELYNRLNNLMQKLGSIDLAEVVKAPKSNNPKDILKKNIWCNTRCNVKCK